MVYSKPVEFSERFLKDLEEIIEYLCFNLLNPKSASDFLDELEKTIERICLFPLAFPSCEYYFIHDDNYRHALLKEYIVFFRITKEKMIQIIRLLHAHNIKPKTAVDVGKI